MMSATHGRVLRVLTPSIKNKGAKMAKYFEFIRKKSNQQLTGLEQLLYELSTYAVPMAVLVISLIALISWEKPRPETYAEQLQLRVIKEADDVHTPAQALARLQDAPAVEHQDTRLSETPFWYTFVIQPAAGDAPIMLEFPSRHAMATVCWDAKTLQKLGEGSRTGTEGQISQVKAGFALSLAPTASTTQVLCRTNSVGPARLAVLQWPASQLEISSDLFHRNSGLLDGGLILLSLSFLLAALINRKSIYVLLAAWLVINLRLGALSAGWDSQWLGHTVPEDWLSRMRLVTIAVYYVLTMTLFRTLFNEEIPKLGYPRLIRLAEWISVPLLLCSMVLPYKSFLPVMWISAAIGIVVVVFFLVRLMILKRSAVAIWYSASIAIILITTFYEIVSAALGVRDLIGSVNSVTAALSSSLLATLAIAEQIKMEHKQRLEAQTELTQAFEVIPIGLFTLDTQGQFLSANPALLAMLGPNVLTKGLNSWQYHFGTPAWLQLHDLVHFPTNGELELSGKEAPGIDEPKQFLVKAILARGKVEGSLQDVTDRSKAIKRLRFLADNDSLTSVWNRRGIETILNSAMDHLAEGKPLALAYLDLDRFKLINDLFGHVAGDDVLKQVCARITKVLTGRQQVGRIGGDEFVIVLPDTTIAVATWICQRIIGVISNETYRVGDKAFHVRGSIGLIEVNPGTKIKDALSTADRACRKAKAGHHEGLVVYEKTASVFQERAAELSLVERLSADRGTDGLFLLMQPIMSLKAPHDSLNFEVLLRMRDHDGSVIPADRLISAGENSGQMAMIDSWVLSTTLAWLGKHHKHMASTHFVCMNLNGASLNDEKFIQDAFAMLGKNSHVAGRLCIEITESVALHDLENTRRFIDKVRGFGAKVALDDFGAGYTSFSYLRDLPADLLKIDGSFVVDMNKHPTNVAIVEAIVNLATNLGMKTIAEWAEDNATVQTLAEIGVDYVQGYAVARPQQPAKILLATSSATFIQNTQLADFVRSLHTRGNPAAQLDLLDSFKFIA